MLKFLICGGVLVIATRCVAMGQEKPYNENTFLRYYMERQRLCKQCNNKYCQGPLPHGPRCCTSVSPAGNNTQQQNATHSWMSLSSGKRDHRNEGCS